MAASKTTNSGTNWIRYSLSSGTGCTYTVIVDPSSSNIVYVGGYESASPAIYMTTNAGGNWSKLSATGLSGYVYSLAIDPTNTDIMYAGTGNGVYKSTNTGSNWSNTGLSGGRTNAVLIDPEDHTVIYAGTNTNGVYKSTDSGGSWTQMNDGLGELTINCLGINPSDYLFAGTGGGSVYRWWLDVGIEEQKQAFEQKFIFFALPNPTTGKTTIHYQLTKETPVELSIYDIQGRLVNVLVNETRSAGTHTAFWNGLDENQRAVSAGVYFFKLTVEEATQMHKLILLK